MTLHPRRQQKETAALLCAAVLACAVTLAAANGLCAETRRIAIVIGHNIGLSDEEPLKYAEHEAAALSKTLVELGSVRPHDVYLLQGKPAAQMWRVLAEVRQRAAEISRRADVLLLFYYSGHGSRDALHIGGTRVSLQKLRQSVLATSARTVIAFVDACQSGAMVRRKGIKRQPKFEIRLDTQQLVRGRVFITSSGELEASLEADDIGGSYFSHYLLSGLRGNADKNQDGRVDLHELYRYTYHRTVLKSAMTRVGTQHPSFDIDLRGSGAVPLSWPMRSDTGLTLGPRLSGTFLIVSKHGHEVISEVETRAGQTAYVALPPQSYIVKKRVRQGYLVGSVNLSWGGKKQLDETNMRFVPYSKAASKGQFFALPTNTIAAAVDLRTGAVQGNPFLLGPRLRFYRALSDVWIIGGVADYHQGQLSGAEISAPTRALGVELQGAGRLSWQRWSFSGGLWAGSGLIWQTITGQESRHSLTFTGGVLVDICWHFAEPLALALELRAGVETAKVNASYGAKPLLALGLGPAFVF